MSHEKREDIWRNGTTTAALAPQGGPFTLPAGDELIIQGDDWRVPRPVKLLRLHFFTGDQGPVGLLVTSLRIDNKQLIYGPIPVAAFSASQLLDPGPPASSVGGLDRWNPFLGTEVTQSTQIALALVNAGGAAIVFGPWFTCGPWTGRPWPSAPNGV